MNDFVRNIPNTITCLNVLSGCIAIIFACRGLDTVACGLAGWQWASIFVGVAAVADFMDGFCARLLHAYSNLGKELDSLCDLVSFGVAPSMILYNILPQCGLPQWCAWAALLIPVAGAVRLAKFNIDTRQATSFIGLPIPANAIFWIGYSAMAANGTTFVAFPAVWLPVAVIVSWLMLSSLKIFSLKFKTWGWRDNWYRYTLVISAFVFVSVMGVAGLAWLIVFYLLMSSFVKSTSHEI